LIRAARSQFWPKLVIGEARSTGERDLVASGLAEPEIGAEDSSRPRHAPEQTNEIAREPHEDGRRLDLGLEA
jgi:hypothetical protein